MKTCKKKTGVYGIQYFFIIIIIFLFLARNKDCRSGPMSSQNLYAEQKFEK